MALSTRLKDVIDSLVSYIQIVFIRGQNIYDSWISALEVVESMRKNKRGLIFKLDFKKSL